MTSTTIYNLIKEIDNSEQESFVVDIQHFGKYEGTKTELIPMLTEKYMELRLLEFNVWLKEQTKTKGLSQRKISAIMGINPVVFTQFLTGFVKSNKKIGDTTQFIWSVKNIIENKETEIKR